MPRNWKKAKAIETKNKERLLKLNPNLNDKSGIYFLTRTDENQISYFYIGQAKHIIQRMCGHLVGYQHIDISIKKRGLYDSLKNPLGWKLGFINYPEQELDKWEQYWILEYTKNGYQCRYNKTSGSQGDGKEKINEFKPQKGYRDGLKQGKKNLARELRHVVDLHLSVTPKKDGNKNDIKALEKFNELIKEENYK